MVKATVEPWPGMLSTLRPPPEAAARLQACFRANGLRRAASSPRAESATLKEAAELLDTRRVGAMVILNEAGGVIGVLSERDIVRNIARIGANALKCTVGEVMTRQVVTARPRDTVEVAMDRMTDRRIRHLPVVEGGRLLGVVSIGDLVKWRIAEADAEVSAIRSYIQP